MITEQRIDEALRFLLSPSEERVKRANEAAKNKQVPVPSVLDDQLMDELRKRDFIQLRKVGGIKYVPMGASVVTDGRGSVAVVEVTDKGRSRVLVNRGSGE